MLKPKIVKLIHEELNIKQEAPFLIEGEKYPYRLKKDGNVERFIGRTWGASSYSIYDIVTLVDGNRITIYSGSLSEYSPNTEVKGKKK